MKRSSSLGQLTVLFLAGLLAACLALPGAAPAQISSRVSVLPMDLSRGPDTEELMAAGQLHGPLNPTHEVANPELRALVNRSFGAAVEAWNRRDYATAQGLFREHLAHYPQSPWASEALLHLAYAALAHSGYGEAQRYFQTVVKHNELSSSPGAQKVLSKARIYLALLKARQGDSSQANKLLSMVGLGSPDWRDRTYASHWLQTLSRQRSGLRDRMQPSGYPLKKMKAKQPPTFGGVGYPRPEDFLGNPQKKRPDNCGAPGWVVNMLNLNFYLSDTPLWYQSPIGPSVAVTLSYNSLSAINRHEPFGNKWQFNYGSYVVEDVGGQVTIFMPDGRRDLYVPDGTGGYTPPFQGFNTLQKIGPQHFELTFRDDTVFVYQIPGGTNSLQPFLTEIRDANGQKLTFGYDAGVHLTSITDALGRVTTLTYDSAGLVTKVADPFGREAAFVYDDHRNLIKLTDMGGYWTELTYDQNVFINRIANARGAWNILNEPADGRSATGEYPAPGASLGENFRITVTNPLGYREEYYYCGLTSPPYSWRVSPKNYVPYVNADQNNWQTAPKTIYKFTNIGVPQINRVEFPAGGTIDYTYDAAGNCTRETFSDAGIYQYAYNPKGLITKIVYPWNLTTNFTYDANGVDLIAAQDGRGTVAWTYDNAHRLTSITDRMGNQNTFAYNGYGQLTGNTDPLGVVTTYVYGPDQQLQEVVRDGHRLSRVTYDALGRVQTFTDATGLTRVMEYSDLDQVTQIIYPDDRSVRFTYSTCCPYLVDSITDRAGRTVAFSYDKLSQLIQKTYPDSSTVRFAYDANGNLSELIDPKSNVTRFKYNYNDWLTMKMYADGDYVLFNYDSKGILQSQSTARGASIFYEYTYGRLTRVKLPTGYDPDGMLGTNYTYDLYSRLTRVQRNSSLGSLLYTYDANSRVTGVIQSWGSSSGNINYQYDALGRRTRMTLNTGQVVNYSYDPVNRLTGVDVNGNTYTFAYAGASPLVQSLTRPNGGVTAYQYDALNRLTGLTNQDAAENLVSQHLYTYNEQDLRAGETVVQPDLPAPLADESVSYNYNRLNQLISASSLDVKNFTYDRDGNLVRGYTPEGYEFGAAYDPFNRLQSLTYTDADGVVHTAKYLYLGPKLDLVRKYLNGVLDREHRYLYDGFLTVQERNNLNQVVHEFTWGLHAYGGINRLLDLNQGGAHYSYLYDGKGNVSGLLDSADKVVTTYQYDPFGVPLAAIGSPSQPMQFSTKSYDAETGLSYYGFRFYSPHMGRWLTRDPLGEYGSVNLYDFVQNDPINFIDPLGLIRWREALRSGAAVIGNTLGAISGGFLAVGTGGVGAVIGGAIVFKSTYSAATNFGNFVGALFDWNQLSSGEVLNDVAQYISPCNKNAQRLSTAANLTIDLIGMRFASTAIIPSFYTLTYGIQGGGLKYGGTFIGHADQLLDIYNGISDIDATLQQIIDNY